MGTLPAARLSVFLPFVRDLATLSKCEDKKTAAIIISNDGSQVYSIGVNGGPRGGADCLCHGNTKYTCVHAEANAIAKCTVNDPNKIFICSYSPCVTCASLIVNSGASAVYYLEAYKDATGLDILRAAGIEVVDMCEEAIRRRKLDRIIDRLRAMHIAILDGDTALGEDGKAAIVAAGLHEGCETITMPEADNVRLRIIWRPITYGD